ncbi:universal stress protein [Actinotalea sp. Marseille-Q4924]|uniref:universal stress protein n=1 Tax=Actinotalea sp. Marseille-Q4924 TaxID=2866571 RepID=UPI001CE4AC19|nr:universal stress protein [Actinotalea sp. Marseille-Q4924]
MTRPVVVGVEGTESSHHALVWAARAALSRHAPLHVVHAVGLPVVGLETYWDDSVERSAKELVEQEAERARDAGPGLDVVTVVDQESPGRALTHRSRDAQLVVVGTHRLTAAERIFSGSLAYQVAAGAHCPVAVVPTLPADVTDRVVVGADGSADSLDAIRAAATEADRAGLSLHVVHAWQQPAVYVDVSLLADYDRAVEEAARVLLGESVAGLAEDFPDLVVTQDLVQEQPATALLDAAQDARLLVVGSRGLHGVARMLLGSVSHAVVLHTPCPVLVVRG